MEIPTQVIVKSYREEIRGIVFSGGGDLWAIWAPLRKIENAHHRELRNRSNRQ